jgi:nucleoid-associated protein YejK
MVRINRAIVHEIPKGRYDAEADSQVVLSGAVSNLAPQTKRFIEENMLEFALKSPRDILEDLGSSSTTPSLVRQILGDADTEFVSASQNLARNLHQAQTGNSPSGILIVATVEGQGRESLVILKAEHQEGMRLRRVGEEGSGHLDLEHLNELIVGNNSRVYKIADLWVEGEEIFGRMVDQQNGVAFADFFMSAFLGCRLADNAEVHTKQFMSSAMAFINDEIADEQRQGRYVQGLLAYMATPAETFQASEFAVQFLEAEDQDDFIGAMPATVASSVISKNLSLVPGHGSGLRLYGSGVMISASATALGKGTVQISQDEEGRTIIRVTESLKRFGLGNAPKE